jgi:WD40 repeat protein
MLVIFAAVSVYALYQGSRASSLGRLALARQLTTQSQLVRSEQVDFEPALLLATDSLLRLDDPEGARAVQEAAALLPRTIARLAHPDVIATVAFTADGRQAVTASGDEILRVFELAADHKEVSRIAIKDMQPRAFSADGRRVALLDGKGGVVIADVATGNEVQHLPEAAGDALGLSPSGRYLASGTNNRLSRDATVKVFEVEPATVVATIPHPGDLLTVAVSDNGRIATGNGFIEGVNRAGVAISDAATGNTARVFQPPATTEVSRVQHNDHVNAIALTRDGRFFVTGSDDKIARVFDAEKGNEIARLTHQGPVNAVAFSPDGHWVATGSDDRTARVFEAATGVEVARLTHLEKVTTVAFSPDSRRVIAGSSDKTARVFEAVGGAELWRVVGDEAITSAAFTADGQRLFAARGHVEAAIAQVYDTLTAKQLLEIKPNEPELRSLAISGDGRFLVIGGGLLGPTRVFKTDDSAHPVASINAPSPVTALGISTDGRRVATMDISNNVRVWDGTNEIARIDDPLNHDLALSGDGRRLAIGNGERGAGAVTIFSLPEIASPQEVGQKPSAIAQLNQKEPVLSVAISEDGRWVGTASGYQPRTTRVYEVGVKEVWSRAPEEVKLIAIDAGVGLVATADGAGIARVMQLATGKDMLRFAAGDPVVSLRIVERGRYLMVASRHMTLDGKYALVVFRQQLRAEDLIADACSRVTRNLTPEEWTKYVGPEVAYRKTCPAIP